MKYAGRILIFFWLVASLLLIGVVISPVSAQNGHEPIGLQNVQLWIYPEYDDPRLLVMLEGQVVGEEPPVEMRFLVPSAAEMYSAGSIDAQGRYSGGPPQREPSPIPGWDEISYEVQTDTFRVEYYDPIIMGQPDKSISYEFRWLYPVSRLEVIVQEPRRATNFNVSPAGQAFVDNQGFTAYRYNYSELDDEPPLQFEITYTKSDTRPSLAIEEGGLSGSLLAVIIVTALCIVLVGVFLWRRQSVPWSRSERRRLARSTATHRPAGVQHEARFCSQCGKPVGRTDKFCASCGAKLR